jgi:hypothetical protein
MGNGLRVTSFFKSNRSKVTQCVFLICGKKCKVSPVSPFNYVDDSECEPSTS